MMSNYAKFMSAVSDRELSLFISNEYNCRRFLNTPNCTATTSGAASVPPNHIVCLFFPDSHFFSAQTPYVRT